MALEVVIGHGLQVTFRTTLLGRSHGIRSTIEFLAN